MGQKKRKKNWDRGNSEELINITKKFQDGVAFHQKGLLQEALKNYNEILGVMPEHADCLYLAGVISHQTGNDQQAVSLIEKAINYNPSKAEYHGTLVKAYNNLGLFYQEEGDTRKASDSYNKALDIDPGFTLALNNLGLIYRDQKDYLNAEKCYRKAIKTDPSFYEAWLNLGNILQDQMLFDESRNCYNEALQLNPLSWQAYNNIGTILEHYKEFESSLDYFNKAIDLNPSYDEAYYNRGCLFQRLEDYKQAVDSYKKCIYYCPEHTNAYNNLGNIYKQQFNYHDAVECYSQVLKIDPQFAGAYSNIGVLFLEMNNLEAASQYLEKAIAIDPSNEDILYNTGLLFLKKNQAEKCLILLNRVQDLNPGYFNAHYVTGNIYKDTGNLDLAIDHYKKALEIEPDSGIVIDQLMFVFQLSCLWEPYQYYFNKLSRLKSPGATTLPFYCLSRYQDSEKILEVSKAYSDEINLKISSYKKKYAYRRKERKNKKVKLGYLSNTFSNHAGGHLISNLFGYHDKNKFTVVCYSYGPDDKSIYRQKIEQDCDAFIDISSMDHTTAADQINQDGIDILIDLRGHTTNNRLEIAALRPAPVQIVYLGFPGTSGADFFDYIIADGIVVPEGDEQYYTEKIIRMPHCYQVNDITQTISNIALSRKDVGLPEDTFVFCSFNNSYKFEPDSFNVWMSILKKAPDSVLWLLKSNEQMKRNLLGEAEKRGVDTNRLIFAEKLPKDQHLERHRLADLGLDTLIYNGHTTTSDSLIAGVPVLTVIGETFPSRVSASILTAAGMEELVVETLDEYELSAVDYALNPDKAEALKSKLRINAAEKPLFNSSLFASELEKKYLKIWTDYLSGA